METILVEILSGAKQCKEANKVAKPSSRWFDFNDELQAKSYARQNERWFNAEQARRVFDIDYLWLNQHEHKRLIIHGYPEKRIMTAIIIDGKARIQYEPGIEDL